jgi:hypothetical protein
MAKTQRTGTPIRKHTEKHANQDSTAARSPASSGVSAAALFVVVFLFIWAALFMLKPIYVQEITNGAATGVTSTGKLVLIAGISSAIIVALASAILAVINSRKAQLPNDTR